MMLLSGVSVYFLWYAKAVKDCWPIKYLLSFLIVGAAAVIQRLLWPIIDPAPFILFYPAVILASLYGDGIVAILLSCFAAQYFFIQPVFSIRGTWPDDFVRQALFLVCALMIRYLTKKLAAAVVHAEKEKRRAEEEKLKAQEAESWLATTLSSIGDAVIATNNQGHVVFMNPVAEGLTQWSLSEAKGKPLVEIFHIINQQTRKISTNPVEVVLEKGGIVGLANHTVLVGRNGKEVCIEDSAAPIRIAAHGAIQGVVLVFRDITEKYSQEEKLADAFKLLQLSELRIRSVLDNALDAVVGMDSEGMITHWNPQAQKIFGFTLDEAVGRRMSETIVPHRYREAHERGMRHYLEAGVGPLLNRRIEITALHRNGVEFPIELSITPIRTANLTFFAAFIRDISEQKKTARDLVLKSEALEHSLNAFDIVNAQGKFVYANRAYLKMWGYDHLNEILGTSPVAHCVDPTIPEKISAALKKHGEYELEFKARRRDGSTFDVRMWARLAHDADGKEIYPTTAIDITDRKLAEESLKAAIQTRDEFISICSHELKTPVTSMKLQFQMAEKLLRKGEEKVFDKDTVRRRVLSANRQLDRMVNLIEEMLDVSRIGSGKLQMKFESLDLGELLHEVIERFSEQLTVQNIPFSVSVLENDIRILGDRYRLEQVISNLMTNAMKYGGGRMINIILTATNGHAYLKVQDEGKGIEQDDLYRIFNRFERVVSSSNISGLGLGLYITRQIVEAHGGKIWAESEINKGSTFIVELKSQ